MKRLILLFVSSLFLISCDVDDDGPRTKLTAAEVTAADLPEFFESGETYDIDVSYLLPSACHSAAGLDVRREGATGDEFRKIYITGVASYDANLIECDEEAEEDELEREDDFQIIIGINEEDSYTFYLWAGVDEDDNNIFTEVVVPIGDPDETDEEATE